MAMEAPLFFRLAELTPPLPLSNKRRFADAGEFGGLGVGVVFEEFHRVVELLSVEFWRTAFAEIRVGRTGDDEHIAAPQLRPQPVPFRLVHLGAGERVRVDFFRAGGGKRLALRLQTVSVPRLLSGRYPYVAEFHVLHLIFLCFDTIPFDHNF